MNARGEDDEEGGSLAHGHVDGEGGDKGPWAIGKKEDGCDAEDNEVGDVVGIPQRLFVARGIARIEDCEENRPEQPPMADGEVPGGAYGPEAEGVEQDEAEQDAGELCGGHGFGLGDVEAVAGGGGLEGAIGFCPAEDGNHEEAALEGLGRSAAGVFWKVEVGRVDVEDGKDAVGGGANEEQCCGESAQAVTP